MARSSTVKGSPTSASLVLTLAEMSAPAGCAKPSRGQAPSARTCSKARSTRGASLVLHPIARPGGSAFLGLFLLVARCLLELIEHTIALRLLPLRLRLFAAVRPRLGAPVGARPHPGLRPIAPVLGPAVARSLLPTASLLPESGAPLSLLPPSQHRSQRRYPRRRRRSRRAWHRAAGWRPSLRPRPASEPASSSRAVGAARSRDSRPRRGRCRRRACFGPEPGHEPERLVVLPYGCSYSARKNSRLPDR